MTLRASEAFGEPDHVRCTVAGCGREHYAKGFCSRHYRNLKRLNGPH